ncbi:hypothetical protein FALBO_1228 [Fusarium albosuccineum]|uniref:Uncharacterized protein n=1 Tax=Fusarium albosuccineum TaxID=1237068 RepID=A0A8H4PDS9_9HYPO|nr:hypothetical protein FALBO_1228 [Fusarium albosuccineum]
MVSQKRLDAIQAKRGRDILRHLAKWPGHADDANPRAWSALLITVREPSHGTSYRWNFASYDDALMVWKTYEAAQEHLGSPFVLDIHDRNPEGEPGCIATAFITRVPNSWMGHVNRMCQGARIPDNPMVYFSSERYVDKVCETLLDAGIIDPSEHVQALAPLTQYHGHCSVNHQQDEMGG